MKPSKFKVGDHVKYLPLGLEGLVSLAFWSDAGDPEQEGYRPRDEHWRYYVDTRKGRYAARDEELQTSPKLSIVSRPENH
jgi:hypothetical protein